MFHFYIFNKNLDSHVQHAFYGEFRDDTWSAKVWDTKNEKLVEFRNYKGHHFKGINLLNIKDLLLMNKILENDKNK